MNGVALWSQRLPGWERASRILAGAAEPPQEPVARPAPELLPPTERRRAPDTVSVALEAALAACRYAHLPPASLPSVFSSMHGDLAITDYMCATMASTPALVSPTKFHNSVHNAAAGYWTIAAECTRPYTSLSAGDYSFGAGLLETCVQAISGDENVLLVAYDIDARGPLAPVANSKGLLSVALILSPERGSHALASFDLELLASEGLVASTARPENAALVAGNSTESCLPLHGSAGAGRRARHPVPCHADAGPEACASRRNESHRRGHHRRRPRGTDAGAAAARALARTGITVIERNTLPVPEAAHKVGESTVEIGAHYLDTVLGLGEHLREAPAAQVRVPVFLQRRTREIDAVTELGASRYLHTPGYQLDRGILENFLCRARARAGHPVA